MSLCLPSRVRSAEVVWHRETLRVSLHGTTVVFPVSEKQDLEMGRYLGDFGHPENQRLSASEATVNLVRGGVSVWIGKLSWFRPVRQNIWNVLRDREIAAREKELSHA